MEPEVSAHSDGFTFKTTRAATTGPARQPLPASSMPKLFNSSLSDDKGISLCSLCLICKYHYFKELGGRGFFDKVLLLYLTAGLLELYAG